MVKNIISNCIPYETADDSDPPGIIKMQSS